MALAACAQHDPAPLFHAGMCHTGEAQYCKIRTKYAYNTIRCAVKYDTVYCKIRYGVL